MRHIPSPGLAPHTSADVKLAVVVLNFNGAPFLGACLSSLTQSSYKDFDTYLVDNRSRDASVDMVRRTFPGVKIIVNEGNLGFAAAYDRVFRALAYDYIVLLNNDTVVDEDWLWSLLETAEASPRTAACTSRVLLMEDPRIVDHAGGVFSVIGSGLEFGKWSHDLCSGGEPFEVGFGTGCSLLVRREAYLKVGGFDPCYVFYHEDVDLCWKFRMFGFSVMYVPESIVYHHVGGGCYQGIDESPSRTYFCQKNRLANMIKNLEAPNLIWGLGISAGYDALRMGRFFLQNRKDLLLAVLTGYAEALARLRDLMSQRRFIQRGRSVSDAELKPYMPPLRTSILEYRRMLKAHRHRAATGKWAGCVE